MTGNSSGFPNSSKPGAPQGKVAPLLTRSDLAERYGVIPHTIDRWVRAGRFPRPLRVAGTALVRWPLDAVLAWEAAHADAARAAGAAGG